MTKSDAKDVGWRGSRELWLSAAYELLVEGGVDAVKIQPLGRRVKLSRTSFYWFFTDRDALLDALLDMWRSKNTGMLVRQSRAYAETITEATLNVFDCWHDGDLFDTEFEFAVRSWALRSELVGQSIREADDARISALADMFVRHGYDATAADVRARAIYLTQIGYISMKSRESVESRMGRVGRYVEIFTGKAPKPAELRRFLARHGLPGSGAGEGTFAA